jgi:hypothetical protein
MMPMAILLVLVGGAVVLGFAALVARIGRLEGRIDSLERRHAEPRVGRAERQCVNNGSAERRPRREIPAGASLFGRMNSLQQRHEVRLRGLAA